jgi:hypothetical protein
MNDHERLLKIAATEMAISALEASLAEAIKELEKLKAEVATAEYDAAVRKLFPPKGD